MPEAPDPWSVAPPPKGRTEWILARPDLGLLVVPQSSGWVAVSLLQCRIVLGADGVLRTRDEHDVLVPEALCPAPLPDETIPGLTLRAAGQIVGGEAQALRQALAAAVTTWAAFRGDPVVLLADEDGRLLVAHGLPLAKKHVLRQTTPAEDFARRLRLLVPAQRHDVLPPWRVLVRAKPLATGHDRLEALLAAAADLWATEAGRLTILEVAPDGLWTVQITSLQGPHGLLAHGPSPASFHEILHAWAGPMRRRPPHRPHLLACILGHSPDTAHRRHQLHKTVRQGAALQATTAKKHIVAAAVALKQGRPGDADALLGQALDALAQAEEETTVVRNTITDRRTAGQKHAARWSPYSQVERAERDPGEILADIAQSLRQRHAA